MTGETCQVKGKHSRLAFGRSERGRSRSTRRRSRRHRIRSDRHGGNLTVRDSSKRAHFFFPTVKISKRAPSADFFRNDSPAEPEGGRRGPRTVGIRTIRAASQRLSPDGRIEVSPVKSKPRRRRVHREIHGSRNRRVPVDARSSEHRAPSRFANPHHRDRGHASSDHASRAPFFSVQTKCDR